MEKEVKPYYEDDYQSLDEMSTIDLLEMKDDAPEQHKDLSILDCEIAVDGEDIDLDEWRDPSDTNES